MAEITQERRDLPNGHYEIILTRPDGRTEILEYDRDDQPVIRTYLEAPPKP